MMSLLINVCIKIKGRYVIFLIKKMEGRDISYKNKIVFEFEK